MEPFQTDGVRLERLTLDGLMQAGLGTPVAVELSKAWNEISSVGLKGETPTETPA